MGTKSVRLDEEVYELVNAQKRGDESFSDAIERLITPPSLRELAGILTEDEAERWLEAIESSRQAQLEAEDQLFGTPDP